jgi:putative transposase
MARPVRVEYPHAAHHVAARGNERKLIYRSDRDRRMFLDTLATACERFGLVVHAYCLMPNHYHLLTQTPRANLSMAVGWLQTTYSIRFNRRHRRSGHLFQGRFKAHLIEADEYAQTLIPYIHLNPVRPGDRRRSISPERRAELRRYEWSSHRAYAGIIGRRSTEPWLCLDWLSYFGRTQRSAQAAYRQQIASMFGQAPASPFQDLRQGLVLGSTSLFNKAKRQIEGSTGQAELRWHRRSEQQAVLSWAQKQAQREPDRRVQIWLLARVAGVSLTTLATRYGYADASGVHRVAARVEQRASQDKALAQTLAAYRKKVSKVKS